MLRGRHRGLPVAIDRAVMFPTEFKRDEDIGDPIRSDTFTQHGTGRVDEKSLNGESFDLRQRSSVRPLEKEEENDSDLNTRRRGHDAV